MVGRSRGYLLAALFLAVAFLMLGQAQAQFVRTIEIKAVGLNDTTLNDENEARACKKFRPTKRQLVRFFNRAQPPVDNAALLHERYSSCAAEGSIRLTDGSFGRWVLFSSGVASITFDDGRIVDLFYRHNGWRDPYACTYGMSGEPEC